MSDASDERYAFLESFAALLLRVPPDRWNKFMGNTEAMATVDEFFRQRDVLELVLGLNPAGQLQPAASFPPTLRGKGVYFVKKKRENITPENCQDGLLVGDIGPSPVEQLITVVQEVGCEHGMACGKPGGAELPAHPLQAAAATTFGGLKKKLNSISRRKSAPGAGRGLAVAAGPAALGAGQAPPAHRAG